jgi:hypothetical protein
VHYWELCIPLHEGEQSIARPRTTQLRSYTVATNDITIGSHAIPLHLRAGDDTDPTMELSTVFQAGFEAGFRMGREAGLKEAGEAAVAQVAAAKKSVRVSVRPRVASERFLLGLPCSTRGAYYGSDEKRCPVCKTHR